MGSRSKSTRTPCNFYALPKNVVLRIFSFLPLPSLLATQQINRRFRILISRSNELRPYLFLEPPSTSPLKIGTPVFLHPVFRRLNFFAYHPTKAVRIGEGLNGVFLKNSNVRKQFATSPALNDLVIRVISGGKWPLDAKIAIENENGVNVWDVLEGITTYFNQYEKISFGDHFGIDTCEKRGYNPKVLMQNHEFLDPDLPFPTIIFPDRDCNKVFIADYSFNTFAALPLVKLPQRWYTEGKKELKLKTKKPAERGKITHKGRGHKQIEEAKPGQLGIVAVEARNVKGLGKANENLSDMKDKEIPTETGSMGSKPMDIHNDSTHQDEGKSINQDRSGDQNDGFTPLGGAPILPRNLTRGGKEAQASNITNEPAPSSKASKPTSLKRSSKSEAERADSTPKQTAFPAWEGIHKPTFQAIEPTEALGVALVELIINTSTKPKDKTSFTTPIKGLIELTNEPRDWDDAFA